MMCIRQDWRYISRPASVRPQESLPLAVALVSSSHIRSKYTVGDELASVAPSRPPDQRFSACSRIGPRRARRPQMRASATLNVGAKTA